MAALRPCPTCNAQVSSAAKSCPHCGEPFAAKKSNDAGLGCLLLFGLPAALIGIALFCGGERELRKITHEPPVVVKTARPALGCQELWQAAQLEPPFITSHQERATSFLDREMCVRLGPVGTAVRVVEFYPEENVAVIERDGKRLWVSRFDLTNDFTTEKRHPFEVGPVDEGKK